MIPFKNILPITTVKKDLMKLIRQSQDDGTTFLITREGKAAGVLMSAEEYEGLMETISILTDVKLIKDINTSRQQIKDKKTYNLNEVFDE